MKKVVMRLVIMNTVLLVASESNKQSLRIQQIEFFLQWQQVCKARVQYVKREVTASDNEIIQVLRDHAWDVIHTISYFLHK